MKKEPETVSMYTFRRFILNIVAGAMGLFLTPSPSFANQWTQLTPTGSPGNKDGQMMVYDSESDRIVMFGDHDACPPPNMTWIYNPQTNTWGQTTPSLSPPGVGHFAMAYDVDHDRVFIYGGQTGAGCNTFSDELWAYNTNTDTWENQNTKTNPLMGPTRPGAKWGSRMVYDTVAHKLIMYGCFNPGCGNTQTWAYDYPTNTWVNLAYSGSPGARSLPAMVFDAPRSRTLMWGDDLTTTWAYVYSTNTWSQVTTTGTAPGTGQAPPDPAYDNQSDRIIFLEDRLSSSGSSRTFAFDPSTNTWTNMNSSPPPSIHHAAMAYVSSIDRVILYGGELPAGNAIETWSYNFDSSTTDTQAPTAPSNLSATAASGFQIDLDWTASTDNVGVTGYRIERCTGSGCTAFNQIATTTGTTYSDTGLSASTTYGYRVRAVDAANNSSNYSNTVYATTFSVPDFGLSANPTSTSLEPGNSTTSIITVTSVNSFNSDVNLTCTTSSTTVDCSLNLTSVTPPANGSNTSTLTVTTQSTTPLGSYTITVTGTSGSLSHPTTFTLTVTDAPTSGNGGGGCSSLKSMNPQPPHLLQITLELAMLFCPIFLVFLKKWRRVINALHLPSWQ